MPAAKGWQRPAPRLRRTYFDCRHGQLHVHQAIPAGGGFDEATALVCLPAAPGSGAWFAPLLAALGADRSIYAPDLPGCGQSDAARAAVPAVQAAAEAVLDLLDSLRERRCGLLVQPAALPIASALAAQRPGLVQRVALVGGDEAALRRALPPDLPGARFELAPAGSAALPATLAPEALAALAAFLGTGRQVA